jgi:hypothetical protein
MPTFFPTTSDLEKLDANITNFNDGATKKIIRKEPNIAYMRKCKLCLAPLLSLFFVASSLKSVMFAAHFSLTLV